MLLNLLLQASQLLEVVRKSKNGEALPSSQSSQPEVTLRRNDFHSSTKLEALVKNLRMCTHIFHS
jgi:DNA repair protein RAD5